MSFSEHSKRKTGTPSKYLKRAIYFYNGAKKGDKWYEFTALGTIATAPQNCNFFSHPFFSEPEENYDILDAMNRYFIWDGIEASNLWIENQFKEVSTKLYELSLHENTLIIADKNLTACLK